MNAHTEIEFSALAGKILACDCCRLDSALLIYIYGELEYPDRFFGVAYEFDDVLQDFVRQLIHRAEIDVTTLAGCVSDVIEAHSRFAEKRSDWQQLFIDLLKESCKT